MDAHLFTADLEARPSALGDLQRVLVTDDPWAQVPEEVGQVLFLGMGSSTFAASVAAARLRALGVDAVAELASSELLPPPDPEQLVVAISASGGSLRRTSARSWKRRASKRLRPTCSMPTAGRRCHRCPTCC